MKRIVVFWAVILIGALTVGYVWYGKKPWEDLPTESLLHRLYPVAVMRRTFVEELAALNLSTDDIELEKHPRCAQQWPKMELLLSVPPAGGEFYELTNLFLPSFSFFWPISRSNTTLLVLTDNDDAAVAETAVTEITDVSRQHGIEHLLSVKLNKRPSLQFRRKGWDRQQWLMFWADNFTSSDVDYVGYVDSDTVFVSRVILSDLFTKKGLPIVRPTFGKIPKMSTHMQWSPRTELAIGRKEPFVCMTYFPVILKLEHLRAIRQHMIRQMNASYFDQAFEQLSKHKSQFSQFNIMCAYLWWYLRDEYSWQIAIHDPYFDRNFEPSQVASIREAEITPESLIQTPRVSIHQTYDKTCAGHPDGLMRVFQAGVCYSMPDELFDQLPSCRKLVHDRENVINHCEWIFEYRDYAETYPLALNAHRNRLKIMDECPLNRQWDLHSPFLVNLIGPLTIRNMHRNLLFGPVGYPSTATVENYGINS